MKDKMMAAIVAANPEIAALDAEDIAAIAEELADKAERRSKKPNPEKEFLK